MFWIGVVVLVTAIAAITGIKARGTRPVARTQLMGAARIVLALGVLLLLYFAYRGRVGG